MATLEAPMPASTRPSVTPTRPPAVPAPPAKVSFGPPIERTDTAAGGSDESDTLTIAEAAAATGVSAHTLRYYERAGLMRYPVARASSSHRRYTVEDVRWVTFLTKLRLTGMPIREMARYARLVRAGEGNEAERLALLTEHRRRVLARLDEVQRNLAAINLKIDSYQERTVR